MKTIRIEINEVVVIVDKKMTKQYLVREISRGKHNEYTILENIEKLTDFVKSKIK